MWFQKQWLSKISVFSFLFSSPLTHIWELQTTLFPKHLLLPCVHMKKWSGLLSKDGGVVPSGVVGVVGAGLVGVAAMSISGWLWWETRNKKKKSLMTYIEKKLFHDEWLVSHNIKSWDANLKNLLKEKVQETFNLRPFTSRDAKLLQYDSLLFLTY